MLSSITEMTKAAVQSGQEAIQTLVDNTTAVQNLTRFAASVGYTCSHEEKDGIYTALDVGSVWLERALHAK